MVLIYSDKTSPRLQYIASFIFKDILKVPYAITAHTESFKFFDGIKINYTATAIAEDEVIIPGQGLLHQKDIKPQSIDAFDFQGNVAFFKTPSSNRKNIYSFDIFAASFYLLSRYEEYLPHQKDKAERYDHRNALAHKENFLHQPLINFWIKDFSEFLAKQNSQFKTQVPGFNFLPTYDVDIAYSFLHKGFVRNAGGFAKSVLSLYAKAVVDRIKVLSGSKKDPFDNFEWLHQLHNEHNLLPLYFFLVAEKNGEYDKNILPQTLAMQNLIKEHADKYPVGLHPSWQSNHDEKLLKEEKQTLEKSSNKEINKSRQHFLKFNLPETYRNLIKAKIKNDYSMGYSGSNGFRASVANSFYWYDLEKDVATDLKIHPFCYMDSTSIFNEKITAAQALAEMKYYYNTCKNVNGTLITIMHNHLLGYDRKEWRDVYEKFLKESL